ncbi:MAG TPA: VWA domain-containing protein [Anaerolineae bacterium]|nr:VWA domain-containing protein [Anaerolineae bacterium]
MDVLWPGSLLLLGLVPLLIAAYIVVLRRRRRFAVRYSSLSLLREALPQRSRWRRHVPVALFLVALSSLVIALSRPVTIVSVPTGQVTVMLTIDVSRSMCATDIEPNRLLAAEAAALSFIHRQGPNIQIGLVAFGGFAELIQPPTSDQEILQDAVTSLLTGRRTAIGSGILKAVDAIAEVDPSIAPSETETTSGPQPTPVPKGAYVPHIIVLLTDGVSNAGPTPLEAAQQAADRGIRVYTIGFGTAENESLPACRTGREPFDSGGRFGGGQFGGGQFGGGGFRRGIDEETLKQVADLTGGEYYSAESAGELNNVFQSLPVQLITKHETTEVSVAFVALGALCAALAMLLALLWQPLP